MRKLVIGDIHGAKVALDQVLERANFDPSSDRLIFLGDCADGWPEVPEVFEFILGLDNYVYIRGNHDEWLYEYLKFGYIKYIWTLQGGQATLDAYLNYANRLMEERHMKLLQRAVYYLEEDGNLFVHGGFNWHLPIQDQLGSDLMWDRHMWSIALYWQMQHDKGMALDTIPGYKEVFIGHTSTSRFDPDLKPVNLSNVWNLDQGGGWEGKLTCMDVDTKEFWQSDIVKDLYPGVKRKVMFYNIGQREKH